MLELRKQGATFTVTDAMLVQDGDPDTTYTVRVLTIDDLTRLTRKCVEANTTKKYNPASGRMDDEIDQRQAQIDLRLALLDHIVVDWAGIVSDGETLPCTLDYKRQLPAERQDRLMALAKDNAQVKAAVREDTFRGAEDLRQLREVGTTESELLSPRT